MVYNTYIHTYIDRRHYAVYYFSTHTYTVTLLLINSYFSHHMHTFVYILSWWWWWWSWWRALYDDGKIYERGSLFPGFRWRVQENSAQYMYEWSKSIQQLQMLSFFLKFFSVFFAFFFLHSEIVFLTCNRTKGIRSQGCFAIFGNLKYFFFFTKRKK